MKVIMNNKQKNIKDVAYLRQITEEKDKMNNQLNNLLTDMIKQGKILSDYEIWTNKKCDIFIQPIYVIEKHKKNLEREGVDENTAYVIVKKGK